MIIFQLSNPTTKLSECGIPGNYPIIHITSFIADFQGGGNPNDVAEVLVSSKYSGCQKFKLFALTQELSQIRTNLMLSLLDDVVFHTNTAAQITVLAQQVEFDAHKLNKMIELQNKNTKTSEKQVKQQTVSSEDIFECLLKAGQVMVEKAKVKFEKQEIKIEDILDFHDQKIYQKIQKIKKDKNRRK